VFRHGHYLLGIEGLALLRAGARRGGDPVEPRVQEIREIAARLEELPYSARRDLPASDVQAGYSSWAQTYGQPGNDTIALEEPIVQRLLDELPPAGCSTRGAAPDDTPRIWLPPATRSSVSTPTRQCSPRPTDDCPKLTCASAS